MTLPARPTAPKSGLPLAESMPLVAVGTGNHNQKSPSTTDTAVSQAPGTRRPLRSS